MIDMLMNQTDYLSTIQEIKAEIQKAQYQATVKVNHELLLLYYHIGQAINRHKVWGNKFIENLSVTFGWNTLMPRDIQCVTSNIWPYSPLFFQKKKLCKRCLHNYHGTMLLPLWIR